MKRMMKRVMDARARLLSADVYRGQGPDSSSILLYTVPVSITVAQSGPRGGRMGSARWREGRRVEGVGYGGGDQEAKGGAQLCQHM